MLKTLKLTALALVAIPLLMAGQALAAPQDWVLLNPKGIVYTEPAPIVPHSFDTLNGKHVVLRWNGKPGGNYFLNKLAELLKAKYPDIRISMAHELHPETAVSGRSADLSEGVDAYVATIVAMKPDLIISSQAD